MNGREDLKQYLLGGGAGAMVGGGLLSVLGVFFLIGGIQEAGNSLAPIAVGIALIVGGILIICGRLKKQRSFDELLASLEAQGKLEGILREFGGASQMFKDSMRLGETMIFPKHQGEMIPYGEIAQAYQYIHKTNYVEDSRALRIRLRSGKVKDIAKLRLRGKDDETLKQVLIFMLTKNSSIKIGYK